MRYLALALLFLNPALWGSFYAIAKNALHHVDPISFATLELSVAAVPALVIMACLHKHIRYNVLRAGVILGVVLFMAVVGSTIALYYTTATNTAFFPALNGAIAAAITIVVLRKRVSPGAVVATCFATAGAVLLIATSSEGGGSPTGDFIALAAAAAYTVYIFAVDRQIGIGNQRTLSELWAIACVEIVTMAVLSWVLLFAVDGSISDMLDNRNVVTAALYVGIFTTFLPTVIAIFCQRYVSPMTVALLYVLEPIWGAIAASIVEAEIITVIGYIGGSLIVFGSIVNVLAEMASARAASSLKRAASS